MRRGHRLLPPPPSPLAALGFSLLLPEPSSGDEGAAKKAWWPEQTGKAMVTQGACLWGPGWRGRPQRRSAHTYTHMHTHAHAHTCTHMHTQHTCTHTSHLGEKCVLGAWCSSLGTVCFLIGGWGEQELKARLEGMEADLAARQARELAAATAAVAEVGEGGEAGAGAGIGAGAGASSTVSAASGAASASAPAARAGATTGEGGEVEGDGEPEAGEGGPPRKTKAQKRREKKREKEAEHEAELAECRATHVDPRVEELGVLDLCLRPLGLRVVEVGPRQPPAPCPRTPSHSHTHVHAHSKGCRPCARNRSRGGNVRRSPCLPPPPRQHTHDN